MSGAIASLAGFLYGGLLINFSNTPGSTFGPGESLSLVVTAVFGGITSITGAVLGSLWIVGIPRLLGDEYALFSSGFAVVLILLLLPGGLATVVFRLRDRVVDAACATGGTVAGARRRAGATQRPDRRSSRDRTRPVRRVAAGRERPQRSAPAPIEAIDVSVRFGGLMASTACRSSAERGEILGLMGPNGAGKTTLFDVLGGNLRADAGHGALRRRATSPPCRPTAGPGSASAARTSRRACSASSRRLESVAISLAASPRRCFVPTMASLPMSAGTERRRARRGVRDPRPARHRHVRRPAGRPAARPASGASPSWRA